MLGEIMAVLAYVLFKVSSGTEREVCQKLVEFDEVMQADIIFGEYDVVGKIATQDLNKLEEFVSQKIRNVPNVLVTSTMIISREYKGKKPATEKQVTAPNSNARMHVPKMVKNPLLAFKQVSTHER